MLGVLYCYSYGRTSGFPSVGQRWTSSRTSSCPQTTTTSTDLRWVRCGASGGYVTSFVLLIITCLQNCTRKSYHDFVGQFDALVDTDVRWTPYTAADIYARAPSGLSSLCLRDHEYWMTRKPILYDIHVEEYHVVGSRWRTRGGGE